MSPETVARLVLFGLALAAFVGIVYVVIRPIELVLEWIAERRGERVADNAMGWFSDSSLMARQSRIARFRMSSSSRYRS